MQKPTFKNKKHLRKQAFTLIELLIVIAIIGILFIVLVSKVDFATDKAKATGVQTDFRSFQVAFETVSRENSGFNTFGWDTGDANQDGVRNSYDEGDTNKDGIQNGTEVFTGRKVYTETFSKVFSLKKNGTGSYDRDALNRLEAAINANLDPKLHITIKDDGEIIMANGAQDPWNKEYHGWYITNAENDKKDRGAIVMYSDGANNKFGSEHKIANGIVGISIPGNNKDGKDDYGMAVIYTYVNGYGEIQKTTSGFTPNQTMNGGNVNDLLPGQPDNPEDPDNPNGDNNQEEPETPTNPTNWTVPLYEPIKLKDSFTQEELKTLFDSCTYRLDWDENYAILIENDFTTIELYRGENDIYSIMLYGIFDQACEYIPGEVLGDGQEEGYYWYEYDESTDTEFLVPVEKASIILTDRTRVHSTFSLQSLNYIFEPHTHQFNNCLCECGIADHNYNAQDTCTACGHFGPGLYLTDTKYRYLLTSKDELISSNKMQSNGKIPFSYDDLNGDLWLWSENGIISKGFIANANGITGIKLAYNTTKIEDWALDNCSFYTFEFNDNIEEIGRYLFYGGTVSSKHHIYEVYWPSTIDTIGEHVFYYAVVEKLHIGSNVTKIEDGAFSYVDVYNVYVDSLEHWYSMEFGEGVHSTPLDGLTERFYVNGVLMKDLVIDESITSISALKFHGFGTPGGKLIFNSHITFDNIGDGAFSSLEGITEIVLNDQMTYLPVGAFTNCVDLQKIVIPKNITKIDDGALASCSSLETIIYEGTVAEWNAMNNHANWCHSWRGDKLIPATHVICSDGTVEI